MRALGIDLDLVTLLDTLLRTLAGVHLWNTSKLVSQDPSDDEDRLLLAARKLSAWEQVPALYR